jgi:hypothetical protein
VLGLAAGLVLFALKDSIVFSIADVVEHRARQPHRLGGLVNPARWCAVTICW